jgi:acyl transferase domain-containing protein
MDQLDERLKKMTPMQRAVFALRETQARLEALERKQTEPIAIVGMACRFPGRANDPASFWRLLSSSTDAIVDVPPDRWDADALYDPDPAAPGKMCSRWGGFLERVDEFDNHFFGISDREGARIDPQQRMLLELAWEALEDAGLPPSSLRGTKTGVFVGIALSEFGMMLSGDLSQTDAYVASGTSLCLAANRLSFVFGLHGPSIALDTACSSSLVALDLACQHIRNGQCEAALVGGASLLLSPVASVNLTKAGFCSTDGRVRAFDAAATGYVRSEGAGVVVIKPLDAALKNGDPIYAVIRGSAVNQNGASNGVTAPSRSAQEQVLREAYARAKVPPAQVEFVETQGTGTRLGDAIEAAALASVLGEARASGDRCLIGAVKTNIGHLEAASGMASLMKAALALRHRQIPANLHFRTPNPDILFDTSPLRVPCKLEPWPESAHPRYAGVSAFGFGGSNAHVVLEEANLECGDSSPLSAVPDRTAGESGDESPHSKSGVGKNNVHLLCLSARTDQALRDLARRYAEYLRNDPPAWSDVCYTATCRREHHDCRLAVLADSPGKAAAILEEFTHGRSTAGLFSGRRPYDRGLKIAFLYGDTVKSGKPYGWQLADAFPGLSVAAEEVDRALQSVAGRPLAAVWAEDARWDEVAFARPALIAVQLAVTAWWRQLGVAPDLVLGQGAGELAAAVAAGILTVEEALRLAVSFGRRDGSSPEEALPARPALLPFISTVDGKPHSGRDLDASHWRTCFAAVGSGLSAALKALDDRHVDVCLGVGPIDACLAPASTPLLPADRAALDVRAVVGKLYAAGIDPRWERLLPAGGRCVRLPTYAWQRQRLWVSVQSRQASNGAAGVPLAARPPVPSKTRADKPPVAPEIAPETAVETRPRADLAVPYVAPRTPLETALAQSWSTVLRIDRVGVHDNFLELGGDSLQATILLNRLQEEVGETLPTHTLFYLQTIDDLAAYLRCHHPEAVRRRYSDEQVTGAGESSTVAFLSIPRLHREKNAEQLLARLDELSDEEVESLLADAAPSEVSHE